MCKLVQLLRMLALIASALCLTLACAQQPAGEAAKMNTLTIRWWGQACFTISDSKTTVLTDPFPADFGYQPPDLEPQVVLVSHEHRDHNAVDAVRGKPVVLRGPGRHEAAGIEFVGVPSFHDDQGGAKRGPNTIFVWEMAGRRLVHLGDLGAPLTQEQLAAIGPVDLAMAPVGGFYTIDAGQAVDVIQALGAGVVLPMHYRTEALSRLPIAPIDDFIAAVGPKEWDVRRHPEPSLSIQADDWPTAGRRVIVLPYE